MGNRAVIIEKGKLKGVYQHWNGGRDSIEAMLYYCKNFMPKEESSLDNFIFVSKCIGFQPDIADNYTELDCDNGDNGVYIISKNYEIVGRMYAPIKEQNHYDLIEFVLGIDEEMPRYFRKGKDYILKHFALCGKNDLEIDNDYDANMSTLQEGSIIYYRNEFWTIIGKNNEKEQWCNGMNIQNMPFFNYTENYGKNDDFYVPDENIEKISHNPNSYVHYKYVAGIDGKAIKIIDDDNFGRVNIELYNKLKEKYKGV